MGLRSINEPEAEGRTAMAFPISINEPPVVPEGLEAGPPTLDSISPSEAAIGSEDVTLSCTGSNFWPSTIITFNGGDEPTTVVSDTEATTIVKPSTASTPGTYPVAVRHGGGPSTTQGFTFLPADGGSVRRAQPEAADKSVPNGLDLRDPDEMEEAIAEEQDDEFKPLR